MGGGGVDDGVQRDGVPGKGLRRKKWSERAGKPAEGPYFSA